MRGSISFCVCIVAPALFYRHDLIFIYFPSLSMPRKKRSPLSNEVALKVLTFCVVPKVHLLSTENHSSTCYESSTHILALPLFVMLGICHNFFVAFACMKTVKWWMWLTLIIFFSPSGQRRTQNAQIWLELGIFVRHFVHKLLVLTKN